jgi:hypothetical protein
MKETTISKNLILLAVLGLGLLGVSANAQFSDNFEGASLNPFWSTALQSGYVVCPSSTRAHSGSYSVELVTTDTGLDKNVRIYHTFAAPTYGTVSFWVYDTAAGFASANSITFYVSRASAAVATIWTPDYSSSTYNWGALGANGPTTVARSQAWHQFTISCLSDSITLKIDGIVVYSGAGGQQFDRVDMDLSGISWRPAWSMQFDDFQFVPDPGLDVHLYAGLTLSGSVGKTYEIQYSSTVNGTNWQPLADITLTNSPYLYFDTNSATTSQRFYRAMLKP